MHYFFCAWEKQICNDLLITKFILQNINLVPKLLFVQVLLNIWLICNTGCICTDTGIRSFIMSEAELKRPMQNLNK